MKMRICHILRENKIEPHSSRYFAVGIGDSNITLSWDKAQDRNPETLPEKSKVNEMLAGLLTHLKAYADDLDADYHFGTIRHYGAKVHVDFQSVLDDKKQRNLAALLAILSAVAKNTEENVITFSYKDVRGFQRGTTLEKLKEILRKK